jgi:hypothetical protein
MFKTSSETSVSAFSSLIESINFELTLPSESTSDGQSERCIIVQVAR